MPLIKCTECQKEISDKATTCPHCGAPTQATKTERRKKRGNIQGAGCLMIVLAIILGLTIVGAPFALLLGVAGVVVLIIGLFS